MASDSERPQRVTVQNDAPRISDVARLAGVSTATVSRALAIPGRVSRETHEKVLKAVETLGYTPNAAARSLRAGRSMMVLIVVPKLANPFFAEISRGIDEVLSPAGYGMIIGDLDNVVDKERHLVNLVFAGHLDGALILSGRIPASAGRSIKDAKIPLVGMCMKLDDPDVPNILVNDREAVRDATRHLLSLGHRHFFYLSGPPHSYVNGERFMGFQEAIAGAGPSVTFERFEGSYTLESGTAAARQYLQLPKPRPTAVIATSDTMAISFMKTVRDAGVSIPGEVSVIGFDGIEFTEFCEPRLTTLRQPRRELGHAGAKALLTLLNDKSASPQEVSERLEVELVHRDSVAPPPGAGPSGKAQREDISSQDIGLPDKSEPVPAE